MDTALLLRAFTPSEKWVERGCGYRQWRLLRGEATPSSDNGGFASAQQVTSQSYTFHGMLGEGNYSQVLQATVRSTQQMVALKIIDKAKVKRYKKSDEVLIEKWVLSRLRHPSIVQLYHAFQEVGALYISMELVPGGELWAITHKVGLPMSISTFYAAQVRRRPSTTCPRERHHCPAQRFRSFVLRIAWGARYCRCWRHYISCTSVTSSTATSSPRTCSSPRMVTSS
jgi:3-phosphoinositide dependent protein kinase-1